MAAPLRTLIVHDLGRVEYEDGLALQRAFSLARRGKVVPDALLLLEHPPVLTMGRAARPEHIKFGPGALRRMGVRVFPTDRGGDVTYHGPGQLIGYPILDLSPDRCDVRRYVRNIEETMIRTAGDFGVKAGRIDGWTGVWVGEKGRDARKLGAIGVHLSRWVTTHGFALNVNTELRYFDLIVPCGIAEAGVTSLEREMGKTVAFEGARQGALKHFAEVFEAEVQPGRFDHRTVSVSILRQGKAGLEALLLRRHPHRGGFWQPVTGTVEPGEASEACARRELGEETGIERPIEPLDYVHSFLFGEPRAERVPRIFQETAYWTMVEGDPPIRLDRSEHAEYAWVAGRDALRRVRFAGLREGLRRAMRAATRKMRR